jgi:hypothetical protein
VPRIKSKREEIKFMELDEPIFGLIELDNLKKKKAMIKKKIPIYNITDLINKPKEWLGLCLRLGDFETAMHYYKNWDITELFRYYTMNLAVNYEPYVEAKSGR